jgi:hypothetical protein
MITSLSWSGDDLKLIRFMEADITKDAVILGNVIYKMTEQRYKEVVEEGDLMYIGLRDLPKNYLELVGLSG